MKKDGTNQSRRSYVGIHTDKLTNIGKIPTGTIPREVENMRQLAKATALGFSKGKA